MNKPTRTFCLAQGGLLNVMWQPVCEGNLGGEWIHVYVWLSPFCDSSETITTLLIGYTPREKKNKVPRINT